MTKYCDFNEISDSTNYRSRSTNTSTLRGDAGDSHLRDCWWAPEKCAGHVWPRGWLPSPVGHGVGLSLHCHTL